MVQEQVSLLFHCQFIENLWRSILLSSLITLVLYIGSKWQNISLAEILVSITILITVDIVNSVEILFGKKKSLLAYALAPLFLTQRNLEIHNLSEVGPGDLFRVVNVSLAISLLGLDCHFLRLSVVLLRSIWTQLPFEKRMKYCGRQQYFISSPSQPVTVLTNHPLLFLLT